RIVFNASGDVEQKNQVYRCGSGLNFQYFAGPTGSFNLKIVGPESGNGAIGGIHRTDNRFEFAFDCFGGSIPPLRD
ncbi:hypothetical protein, partial [Vibrio parahaemolyticus]|uniref:hypothetical protein n=1 Tax=Vibrio parahaemolyticus TaxID=670 RepID=UPI001A8E7FA3